MKTLKTLLFVLLFTITISAQPEQDSTKAKDYDKILGQIDQMLSSNYQKIQQSNDLIKNIKAQIYDVIVDTQNLEEQKRRYQELKKGLKQKKGDSK